MSTEYAYPDLEQYEAFQFGDGAVVEVKRPKRRVRLGRFISECKHCGYEGRAERGKLPRPSQRAAQFCPSCRGGI